jgi:hypothetical protein
MLTLETTSRRLPGIFLQNRKSHCQETLLYSVGVGSQKKQHRFDLGAENPAMLVECKSHTWTQGGNMPSAKLTVWNEAMYYFHVAPKQYRKIFFVLKHMRKEVSLAAYYLANYYHLIPEDVEIWEYCTVDQAGRRIR